MREKLKVQGLALCFPLHLHILVQFSYEGIYEKRLTSSFPAQDKNICWKQKLLPYQPPSHQAFSITPLYECESCERLVSGSGSLSSSRFSCGTSREMMV